MSIDLLGDMTLVLLLLTVCVLALGLTRRARGRETRPQLDFPVLVIFFVVGWFSTDLVSSMVGMEWQGVVSFSYMLILIGFLAMLLMRLGWAGTEAKRSRHIKEDDSNLDYGNEIIP